MKPKRLFAVGWAIATLTLVSASYARSETEYEKLFAAPLAEGEVAYMCLLYSGVIVRTSTGTVIIDPADVLFDDDIAALAKHRIDALLYTHVHGDHYDAATARNLVQKTGTTVVADREVAKMIRASGSIPADKLIVATPGKNLKVGPAEIRGITGRHVGPITLYYIRLGSVSIFHGGDSAYVPAADYPSRLAFLPAGSPSPTASPADALKMARDVKPRTVVLIHGQDGEYAAFKKLAAKELPGVAVEVGEPFKARVARLN